MPDTRDKNTICIHCFGTLDPKTGVCTTCNKRAELNNTMPYAIAPRTLLGGRYFIGLPLGRGGFGITYKAYDTILSTPVAIKEFFPKGYIQRLPSSLSFDLRNPETAKTFHYWLTAFVDEAKVLTSIKHLSGIVGIYDFFMTNSTAYLVMEYLDGLSLHRFMTDRGERLEFSEALSVLRPVFDTLSTLHRHGIIHKDISPENIQIVDGQTVKLIDFGAASIYNKQISKPFFVLKKGYSPIELYYKDREQGPWTDIYELGATVYTCLVGKPPQEASERKKSDKLVPPSELNIQIPPATEKALLKALAVNPEDRFKTVDEFKAALYDETQN